MNELRTWDEVKDEVYGKIGTEYRDRLEREAQTFVKRILERQEREDNRLKRNQSNIS